MGNRLAKWARFCLLNVEVNPLVVACCIGEQLHLLLGHSEVVAIAKMLAYMGFEVFVVFDNGGHRNRLAVPNALMLTALSVKEEGHEGYVECQRNERIGQGVLNGNESNNEWRD